jgi:iron complex outermembrane receptor protein
MFFPMYDSVRKRSLMTGVALTALATGMCMPAFAQAPSSNATGAISADKLEEIVVTARRKEELLQEIPVSVGTLSEQALQNNQISNVNDLGAVVAGLFTAKTPEPGGGYLTIRGIQNNALPTPSADSAVGFYVDGIYIARGEANGFDIPDLARVEVARGPQGTLFGRNTTGGAINFITNQPTDEYEAHARFLYGSYAHVLGSAVVNLPITQDLMIRACLSA